MRFSLSNIDSTATRFDTFLISDNISNSNVDQRRCGWIVELSLSRLGDIMHELGILLLIILIPTGQSLS